MLTIVKKNDTHDAIQYQLENEDGSKVNLTGASVQFIMGKKNKLITNNAASILSSADGIVQYQLTESDTLVSGQFLGEFVVTFSDGTRKTFPSNGYITVNIEQNLDTDQNNIVLDMIAEKQGEFTAKLNSILQQAGSINMSYMNEYTWTSIEGQLSYTFPVTSTYNKNAKWFRVYVGNIPVDSSLVNHNYDNKFELLVDPVLIKEGTTVVAQWIEPIAPVQPTSYKVIPQQATPPADAVEGDMWFDTSDNAFQGTVLEPLEDRVSATESSLSDIANRFDYVTYTMFDAKLDGVTDDTLAIKSCHDYANANNLKVIQNQGIIYITDTITVQTSTDLSGCTLKLKSTAQKNKILYKITSKQSVINVTGVNQSELVMGVNKIPSLSNYKHNMITIISNELLAVRHDGGTTTNMSKKDSFFLTRDGAMTSGKLIQDFTTGVLTITATPYESNKLVFKGLKIDWDFKDLLSTCTVIDLSRSNTVLKDIFLNIPNTIDYDDSVSGSYKAQAFNIHDCYNVHFENSIAENITDGNVASGYILNMSHVVNVTFRNITWLNGWGATGTNNVRDWKVFDSKINRIDAHTGTNDLYCKNVTFLGGWGVFLGYGDGRVILEDCISDFVNIDGRENNSVVYLGVTYGVIYQGEISIKNHKIVSRTPNDKYLFRAPLAGTGFDYSLAYDLQLPSLMARDITFEGTGVEKLYGYYVNGINTMSTTLIANNKKIGFPKYIDIQRVRANIDNDNSYFVGVTWSTSSAIPAANYLDGGTDIVLKDIRQSVHSYFKNGFTDAQLTSNQTPKQLIAVTDLYSDYARIKHKLSIDRCGGTVTFETKSTLVQITNSEISALDVEGSANQSPDRLTVNGCELYLTSNNLHTLSILNNVLLEGRNNIFHLCMKDGVYLPITEFNYAGGAKLLSGNYFGNGGSVVTTALLSKYDQYVNGFIGGSATKKTGSLTYSGDGISTTKTIPHGLNGTPSVWFVQETSLAAGDAEIKYVTADATNLTVYFKVAPVSATNNMGLKWRAEI